MPFLFKFMRIIDNKMHYRNYIVTDSDIPKYKQVVDLFISDIEAGFYKKGQRIPSINDLSAELFVSRDTVEKAFVYMKEKGIINAVKGKGYYINQTLVSGKKKVCLILNKLSNYKRSIYYSLVNSLGNKAGVDVFIYNYNPDEFVSIIENNLKSFDYYVILLHQECENKVTADAIKKLPKEKVIFIDRIPDAFKDYPIVYQEYDKDIQNALSFGIDLLKKYKKLNLIFPSNEYYPTNIVRGFRIFCQINNFENEIFNSIDKLEIKTNEAYIIVSDDDLYEFISRMKKMNLIAGTDCGIVAYNENKVKEILCDGITTISTNHEEIGQLAAKMILSGNFERKKSPFNFISRKSL